MGRFDDENNFEVSADNEYLFGTNKSFDSVSGSDPRSPNNAASSKAVLAALRALQDKIRRLENERTQALDEFQKVKNQLQTLEVESAASAQKERLTADKSLSDARNVIEKLHSEKGQLETRLSKLEIVNKDNKVVSEELNGKIKTLKDEILAEQERHKDLLNQQHHLDMQLQSSYQREKDLGQALVFESKRHEDEMKLLHSKVQSHKDDLAVISDEKRGAASTLAELDQLVSQLLGVNESLVSQLAGRPPVRTSVAVSKKVKGRPQTAGAAVNMGVPFTANPVPGKKIPYGHRQSTTSNNTVEHLQELHNMYANLANNIISRKGTKKTVKKAGKGLSSEAAHVSSSFFTPTTRKKTRLSRRKANELHIEEKITGISTALPKGRSFSSSSAFIERKSNPVTNNERVKSADGKVTTSHIKTKSISDGSLLALCDEDSDDSSVEPQPAAMHSSQVGRSQKNPIRVPQPKAFSPAGHTVGITLSRSPSSSPDFSSSSQPPNGPAAMSRVDPVQIDHNLATLEHEFDTLNTQYRGLLSTVHSEGASNIEDTDNTDELIGIIQRLHQKGDQLRHMKTSSPSNLSHL